MYLSVAFSEIPEHGLQVELTDISWFPEEVVTRIGNVSVDLVLAKKGENKVELSGKVEAKVRLDCDRCLSCFDYTIDSSIQVILEVPDSSHHWHIRNVEHGEADVESVVLSEPVVEIGDILRQQILLALPEKRICSVGCLGLCDKCGTNLNEGPCQCRKKGVSSPFAVLAHYKKK